MDEPTEPVQEPDPYQLWDRLVPGRILDSLTAEVAATYWKAQKAYNQVSLCRCSGLKALKPRVVERFPRYCGSILCPGCWYKHQMSIMQRVQRINAPWWHVRVTNSLPIGQTHHPKVMSRFKARGGEFQTVAWVIAPEVWLDGVTGQEEVQVYYKYVGIFVSDKPIRNWAVAYDLDGNRVEGSVFRDNTKKDWVGSVDLYSYESADEALSKWITENDHPALMTERDDFRDIQQFIHGLGHQRYLANPASLRRLPRAKEINL